MKRDEVFPNKDLGSTGNGYEYTFDMAYFPNERGPYNYNPAISVDGKTFTDKAPLAKYGNRYRAEDALAVVRQIAEPSALAELN